MLLSKIIRLPLKLTISLREGTALNFANTLPNGLKEQRKALASAQL